MKLLKRVKDLLQSNLNDFVESQRDPEQAVAALIQQIEAQIRQCREQNARAIATRQSIIRQLVAARQAFEESRKQSEDAATDSKEQKTAVRSRLEHQQACDDLEKELKHAIEQVTRHRDTLHALEDKIQEVRRKREYLEGRRRLAQVEQNMAVTREIVAKQSEQALDRLQSQSERIEWLHAEAQAYDALLESGGGPLEACDRLQREEKVADEIRALEKQKRERYFGT